MIIVTLIIVIVIIVIVIIGIVIIVIVILVIDIISNVSNSFENNVYIDSSVYVCEKKVFNFLHGGRSINKSTREWKDLILSIRWNQVLTLILPFLVVTATLLQSINQSIIPNCYWPAMVLCSIGSNRNRTTTTTTKRVINDEETVRPAQAQASKASVTNEDHNFIS